METKLKSLIGKPDIALLLDTDETWFEEVTIKTVTDGMVTFTWVDEDGGIWERTAYTEAVLQIDVKISSLEEVAAEALEVSKQRLERLLQF